MKNESNNNQQTEAMPYDAMLGTVISNEEICRKKCLDCGYDGGDVGKDSCVNCGCRYEPNENNENCPKCGCDDYDTHCPKCDSDNIVYWDEYQAMLADGTLS